MGPLRATIVYLCLVFVGGALVAPGLYHLAQWLAERLPGLEGLAAQPFHRYVNRSMLGLALIGLWPYRRALGIGSWRKLGLDGTPGAGREFFAGFALGLASLGALVAVPLLVGARELNPALDAGWAVSRLFSAGVTALTVALIEEVLFRGALFGALRRAHSLPVALGVSSAIYSLVHFFQRPETPEVIDWSAGLALLPRMLRGFGDAEMLLPGFLNLFLAGAVLAMLYHRTGSLYSAIGLHAGWIFWLRTHRGLTHARADAVVWLWGTGNLTDGWLAAVVLGATLLWVQRGWRADRGPARRGLTA